MIPQEIAVTDSTGRMLTEEDIRMRIDELRSMVQGNTQLRRLRNDDAFLLRFLNASNFNGDNAIIKMTEYYTLIAKNPEWYNIDSPEDNKHLLQKNMRIVLSNRDREGRCIYLAKLGNIDPSIVTIKDLVKLDELWLESQLDEPLTQRKGICVIVDVSGYSYKMFQWLTPSTIRFSVNKFDALPVKGIIIHFVNTSFLLNASVKICWPFLSQKLRESLKFHYNNMESLHKYISPESLPREYGGTADVDYDKLIQKFIDRNNEMVERTKYIKLIISGN